MGNKNYYRNSFQIKFESDLRVAIIKGFLNHFLKPSIYAAFKRKLMN